MECAIKMSRNLNTHAPSLHSDNNNGNNARFDSNKIKTVQEMIYWIHNNIHDLEIPFLFLINKTDSLPQNQDISIVAGMYNNVNVFVACLLC